MIKEKIPFSNILIESFSVIFAVLLALFVNEWRKDVSDDKLAESALYNILTEIKENKSNLKNSIDLHEQTVKDLDLILNKSSDIMKDSTIQDYNFQLLSKISWEAAVLTDIIHNINFKLVSELAGVYEEQKLYSDLVNKMMDRLVFESKYDNNDELIITIKNHRKYFFVLIGIEKQLLEKYENFLKENDFPANSEDY